MTLRGSGVAGARTGAKAGARMRAKLTSCAWLGAAIVVGVTNRLVREKMLDEFKRAAIQSTMR